MNPIEPPSGAVPTGPTRLNAAATLSVLSSVSGFVCLWGFGGLVGVILGLVSRSEIDRSEGRQHGRGLATAGIAIGILNVACFILGVAGLITWMAASGPRTSSPAIPMVPPVAAPLPAPETSGNPGERESASGAATRERETRITRIGSITLVDPGTAAGQLHDILSGEQALAASSGEKLVVWIVALDCSPCNGVAAALPDQRLQKALDHVRLVRLDVREYAGELSRLGIPVEVFPGFALLGGDLHPRDYVNGGEWGADIAPNIAPVLSAFVRGTYLKRKEPWTGPARGDETTL